MVTSNEAESVHVGSKSGGSIPLDRAIVVDFKGRKFLGTAFDIT